MKTATYPDYDGSFDEFEEFTYKNGNVYVPYEDVRDVGEGWIVEERISGVPFLITNITETRAGEYGDPPLSERNNCSEDEHVIEGQYVGSEKTYGIHESALL